MVTQEYNHKIGLACHLQESGQYDKAESMYLEAISCLDKSEGQEIGTVHINLGSNSWAGGRLEDAVDYYNKAIKYLESYKGEAILQKAHAHFNIAYIYYMDKDSRAIHNSEKAMENYVRFPFTEQKYMADAKLLLYMSPIITKGATVIHKELFDLWDDIKVTTFNSLDTQLVSDYIGLLLSGSKIVGEDRYSHTKKDLLQWADKNFVEEIAIQFEDSVKKRSPYPWE